MKKVWASILVIVVLLSVVGCGSNGTTISDGDVKTNNEASSIANEASIKLTMMVNFQSSEAVTAELQNAVNNFMSEYQNIEVELIPGSSEYEALMKAKMATNDLPDLFTTHGWSVLRYSEYLLPIEDQAWVADLHPAIEPVITSTEGHIYVLPMDVDIAGIAYNKEVVENAGVDVTTIKTWDQFFDAMDAVKATGVTPIHIGGKDHWTVGNFLDWVAPSIFVTDENNYQGDALKSGNFDTATWTKATELMKRLKDDAYINIDVLTSTYPDSARALGEGSAAFEFFGNYVIAEAMTYNPEAKLGFFPVPAYYEGDEPTLISGERTAIGIWKDSKNTEAAKQLLSYLARPEVMARVATANGIPAGLTTAISDTGSLADSYEQWKSVEAYPYFDRVYLPSGMWDTMCSTGTGVLSGEMTPLEASDKMLEDFTRLYK